MSLADLPLELLSAIAAQVYASGLPTSPVSLDPLFTFDDAHAPPVALPSAMPPSSWPEPVARHTLASLCRVNHACAAAAKPWLWRSIQVRLPRSWLALLDQLVEDGEGSGEEEAVAPSPSAAPSAACAGPVALREGAALEGWDSPDLSVPPELLSPAASRDPSPRRLRSKSKSPPRWKMIRSLTDAMENMMARDGSAFYIPTPEDPRPGRFVTRLDFNHFRTIGMRRSVEEGVKSRFVTGDRLEAVLKEMPNLVSFGATEYMDGALTLPVLKELLLRGSPSSGRGRSHRLATDCDEDRERLRECKELEALDLTGCVSSVFVDALTQFVAHHVAPESGAEQQQHQRPGASDCVVFPGLRRLGLRGVKSVSGAVLNALILACPSLTHLDASCTRITSELLDAMADSRTLRFRALSLERCVALTGESIAAFLVGAPAAADIRDLNLYGDGKFPSPLREEHMHAVLTRAPCFLSGQLVYLDLSSAPLTPRLLRDAFVPQPQLRSLGVAHIPALPLGALRDFVRDKAPHVEVLSMACTSPELGYAPLAVNGVERRATMAASELALHMQLINPLCTSPVTFSWRADAGAARKEPPTRVRVVELATGLIAGLHAGAGSWRVVRSKGGRAWYVDTACGWVAPPGGGGAAALRRELAEEHPLRVEMEKLARANGNVSSGVGWHARKMEILYGEGMLGREDGLYGAGAFAFQG